MVRNPKLASTIIFFISVCLSGCISIPFKVEPLSIGSSAKKLNLVFVPLNYQSREDFLKDREVLAKRIQKAVPFSEFPEAVKLWDLDMAEDQARKVFHPSGEFPPWRVDPGFVKKIFRKIGANFKLILLDNTGTAYCSELSSPEATSVIILGRRHFSEEPLFPSGFLHELGHSLGLRDESAKGAARSCVPGYPNCAATKVEAEKWWGSLVGKNKQVGFFQGCCGREDHFRPAAVSLMNDVYHSSNFGPVNEAYLRKVLERSQENGSFAA